MLGFHNFDRASAAVPDHGITEGYYPWQLQDLLSRNAGWYVTEHDYASLVQFELRTPAYCSLTSATIPSSTRLQDGVHDESITMKVSIKSMRRVKDAHLGGIHVMGIRQQHITLFECAHCHCAG